MDVSSLDFIRMSIQTGIDGIVLIERNRLISNEEIDALKKECGSDDFLILKGQEIMTPEGWMLVYGCDEELQDSENIWEVLTKVRALGGCAVLSHPFSSGNLFESSNDELTRFFSSFDAVEIYNSNLSKHEQKQALELHWKSGFTAVAGSEAYQTDKIGTYATKFSTEIKNEKDLARAINEKKARPVILEGQDVDPRGGNQTFIEWNVKKSLIMKCEGLLFDLYGTLVNLSSFESLEEFVKIAQWLEQQGIDVSGKALYNFYLNRANELYRFAGEKISFPEVDILKVFREAIEHFSGEDRGEDFARKAALIFRALSIRSIKPYTFTRKVLRELKKRGYRMGIISNGQAAFTIPEIEDLNLQKFFDFIILSSDVGCSKPEHKIFNIAITQLEIPVSKTVMIGDDPHGDIYAAKGAGLKTVYIKSNVETSQFPVKPDVSLSDGDLRNLLRVFP